MLLRSKVLAPLAFLQAQHLHHPLESMGPFLASPLLVGQYSQWVQQEASFLEA
jgi:hypothetical protein